ncbi:TPA: hypothetical protein ACS7XC_000848 [Providencia alcalifaciens]
MRKLLFGFIFSLACSTSSLADWKYITDVDEMRNEASYYGVLSNEANSKLGDEQLDIILFSPDNTSITSMEIQTVKSAIDCEYSKCKALVRFGNGQIENVVYAVVTPERDFVVPIEYMEFARKIKNSDVVFIELPIEGKGMQQFKFKTSGLKWKVE